jgi:hypothetical protein
MCKNVCVARQVDAIEEGANEGHDEELGLPSGSAPLEVPVPGSDASALAAVPPPVRAGQPAHTVSGGNLSSQDDPLPTSTGSGSRLAGGGDGSARGGGRSGGGRGGGNGLRGGGGRQASGALDRPMDATAAAGHALVGIGEDVGAAGGQVCRVPGLGFVLPTARLSSGCGMAAQGWAGCKYADGGSLCLWATPHGLLLCARSV